MTPRTKEQTKHSHGRCLYCGELIPRTDLQAHLDAHVERWRKAPRA